MGLRRFVRRAVDVYVDWQRGGIQDIKAIAESPVGQAAIVAGASAAGIPAPVTQMGMRMAGMPPHLGQRLGTQGNLPTPWQTQQVANYYQPQAFAGFGAPRARGRARRRRRSRR